MRRNWVRGVLITFAFLLATLYGAGPLFLPHQQPASIPADQFSAERAMQHVVELSQAPRVAGTPGIEQAATYIAGVLRSCGIPSEVQTHPSEFGTLQNVVARLRGSGSGQALLIVSHFDSVSFGAGDNASGAAVLLETACALQAGKPFTNDIILLFEDGEEKGYLGGYAFAAADSSMPTVRRAIGLDTAAWGPVVLLQTTPGNASFIETYAYSVKDPVAFGFFAEADWTISADTSEVQPYYERDIPGLALEDPTAFTGKHTSRDTVEEVRAGSLQQMGEQTLSLARALGESDLTTTSTTDQSYFTLWAIGMVHYPAGANLILALLASLGLILLVWKGIHQKSFPGRDLLASLGILFSTLIGSFTAGLIGSKVFEALFPNPNPQSGSYLLPASLPFFLAFIALVGFSWAMIRQKLSQRRGVDAVRLAGLILWTLLALLTAILLPVGSAIFTLPLLAAVLCASLPDRLRWASLLPAILATTLFTPNLALAFLGTGLQTLPLVTLMAGLLVELWGEAWVSLLLSERKTTRIRTGNSSAIAHHTGS